MDVSEAIPHALAGHAILFFGAGFSRGATNIKAGSLKSGPELAAYLAEEASIPRDSPLQDAAEEFRTVYGTTRWFAF